MALFNRSKAGLVVSVVSLAVLGAIPLTPAVAEDGAERLRAFHKVGQEQRLVAAESPVRPVLTPVEKPQQIERRSSSAKRKHYIPGFPKRRGR